MDNRKALATKVKVARVQHELTQTQLAEKADVSLSTIYYLENPSAGKIPQTMTLFKIAKVLDLDLNELQSLLED